MMSHEVAWWLLKKPNAPLVAMSLRHIDKEPMSLNGIRVLKEVTSIAYTNLGHFIDSNGKEGDDYNSGRECIEIK